MAKNAPISATSISADFPMLDVRDLTLVREDSRILDGVSWRVEHGQNWVILGANGSGKTSLLSTLTGYLTPTDGEMNLLGERYGEANWPELRKKVGIVSSAMQQQMAGDEPALETVVSGKYAMIDFWGRVTPADRKAARAILRQINGTQLAERPWRLLSQGERQRVLIGRALMARPQLLILDEPCSGLDPVAREHFLQFLNRLGQSDTAPTLLLVTHHVEEMVPAFRHVLVLKTGRVLAAGERERVLTSRTLSEAFGEPVRLHRRNGRESLSVELSSQRMFQAR